MMTALASPIERARGYLLSAAATAFSETRHRMRFPREMGFAAPEEAQSTDVFARAVLGDLLMDMAALADDADFAAVLRDIAHREAAHVAAARLVDRAGGWSYFPGLPELPPDADSLAAALTLFVRAAPEFISLCVEPIDLALATQTADGSIETWIVAPDGAGTKSAIEGIRRFWGRDRAVDVCARFFRALHLHDPRRHRDAISRGAGFIERSQDADGGWHAQWYFGRCYPTLLAVDLLAALDAKSPAIDRALGHLTATQRPDGGWGVWQSVPLDTALALWLLARADADAYRDVIGRGLPCMLGYQARAGNWRASPWIKMDVGRPQDFLSHTLTYQSETIASAVCLRTLLLLRRNGFGVT